MFSISLYPIRSTVTAAVLAAWFIATAPAQVQTGLAALGWLS